MTSQTSPAETNMALKEWAIICAALAAGKQTILVRKGGIEEGPDGFQPEHRLFWLFPTNFHQDPSALNSTGQSFIADESLSDLMTPPPSGQIRMTHVARVVQVTRIEDEALLPALSSCQLLSAETVSSRFHYRQPGLWAMVVRVYDNTEPVVIPDSPHLAGCRSWVDLPRSFSCSFNRPVLSDSEYEAQVRQLNSLLNPPRPG